MEIDSNTKMAQKMSANTAALVISTNGQDETEVSVKPSAGSAIRGATIGALIGVRFGPIGAAIGAGIGGTLGYVLGDD